MKPNFALSLFFDKVELLHRSGEDWTSIGEVPFETENLAGALSDLRKKALTHDPAGLRTKLILPDEQVKFLSLPDANADDAAVRSALEDATPYALDDLVYEFASEGRRTHVAAVAKETLAEAEAFAVEHRFAPVSIVGQTVVGRFDGEPFFGETKACAALIGPDDQVERDNPPAAKVAAKAAPEPKVQPAAKSKAKTEPTAKIELEAKSEPVPDQDLKAAKQAMDAPEPPKAPPAQIKDPKAEVAPKPTKPEEPAPAKATAPAKPTVPPKSKPDAPTSDSDEPLKEPVFASRARSATIDAGTIQQAVSSVRPIDPAPSAKPQTTPRAAPQAVPPRPAPGTPPPAVAERLAKVARTSITADRLADTPPAFASRVPDRPTGAAAKAPPITGTSAATTTSPKAIAATLKPQKTPPVAAGGELFASRRADEAPASDEDALAPQTAAATAADRRNMTVFDERAETARGRSKYLPLILTAVLLLFMAAVAAFASMFTEDGIAGWFGASSGDLAEDPILTATPSDTTPVSPLAVPAIEDGTALVVPGSSDPVETTFAPAEQLARAVEDAGPALDDAVIAIPEPPTEEQAALDPPVVTPDTPPGTVLSPAEADRFYAATGVWLRAPRLPLLPASQDLDRVARASVEDTFQIAFVPPNLPEIGTLYPDAPLPVQIDPPTAETVFERDARGLLLATAEGTLSPYGMLIYAGLPDVVPPTRPGTPVPEPVAVIEEVTPEAEAPADDVIAEGTSDTDPTEAVVESLETLIADAATEDLAPVTVERDGRGLIVATAEGAASDGLIVYAGLPAVVPPTRPGTTVPDIDAVIAEISDAPAVEDDAALSGAEAVPEDEALEEPSVTVGYDGVRPAPRPDTLEVPEAPVELAAFAGPRPNLRPEGLDDAAASAEPEEPEIDNSTVAATLAAIVAAAPDPLANATQQAVAVATIPAVRPRNFDRVVASARAQQQTTTAAAATTATAPTTVSSAAAQPTGPIPQSVASAATIEGAINLRQVNLIGVFGRPNDRRALVRLGNGSFVRVSVGDSLDGGQVTAIGDNVINYVRRGQTIALGVPG